MSSSQTRLTVAGTGIPGRDAAVADRTVVVLPHPGRVEALRTAADVVVRIAARGIATLVRPEVREHLAPHVDELAGDSPVALRTLDEGAAGSELVLVFGGDGSILRGAEVALPLGIPLLGVNLGHVGFLAELEASQVDDLVDQVDKRSYQVERRLTLQVRALDPSGATCWESFAVNEVSVEKIARERMLEVMARVDGRALSLWGCDGVLVSTPSGSTAYAFSAGGPVLWPDVEAIELVPLSAHALFARPLVLSPASRVELEVSAERGIPAAIWADGARTVDVEPGSTVQMERGPQDLLLARLAEQPFTDRLVKKFGLPVAGFRGRG